MGSCSGANTNRFRGAVSGRRPRAPWQPVPVQAPRPLRDTARTMAEEKVELLRRAYAALNAGDVEAALETADDDLVIKRAGPDPPVRGKDAIRAFLAPDAFSEQLFEPLEFRENGSFVFVWLMVRAQGATSDIALEQNAAHVWEFQDGKAASLTVSFDRAEALEAAGLSQ